VVLGDRYELRGLIGTGGSGSVHLAHDRLLRRDVAIKVLRPGHDDVARARLRAEARTAAALTHPGIARLLDLGEDETEEGPAPYLVMEYVEGRTLREVLRAGDRLSTVQMLRVLAEVADALAAVHGAGIVHRDLKPSNIMLTPSGRVVLLDFGIARHHDDDPLTLTGTIVGTVDYISPEQASGASASPASDLYALGMVAYECLTGLRPLSRDTIVSTLMAHASVAVPPLPPTVATAGVRDLVRSMTALDPADRPPNAATVAAHARALLRDPDVGRSNTSVAIPAPAPAPAAAAAPAPVVATAPTVRRLRRHQAVAAAGVVLVALATTGLLLGKSRAPASPAEGAPAPSAAASPQAPAATVPAAAKTPAARHVAARPVVPLRQVAPAHVVPHPAAKHVKHPAAKHAPKPGHHHPGRGHGPGHGHGH
jgi:serine/threonine-protein kinase